MNSDKLTMNFDKLTMNSDKRSRTSFGCVQDDTVTVSTAELVTVSTVELVSLSEVEGAFFLPSVTWAHDPAGK